MIVTEKKVIPAAKYSGAVIKRRAVTPSVLFAHADDFPLPAR